MILGVSLATYALVHVLIPVFAVKLFREEPTIEMPALPNRKICF
jgi:hypothetical protein